MGGGKTHLTLARGACSRLSMRGLPRKFPERKNTAEEILTGSRYIIQCIQLPKKVHVCILLRNINVRSNVKVCHVGFVFGIPKLRYISFFSTPTLLPYSDTNVL